MKRTAIFGYGVVSYLLFLAVFSYMAGFLLELLVPRGINDVAPVAVTHPVGAAALNIALIALFGALHSMLARDWAKDILLKMLPASAERSTFVLQSSLCLALAMWLWQPMTGTIWHVEGWATVPFYAGFAIGASIVLWSTFLIDHFELFGLRQIWTELTGKPMPDPVFRTPALYRFVRHPMQLGVVILLLSTPHMTVGHALFAGAMIAYIFVGLYFEERALVRHFGARYTAYQAEVPMLFPRIGLRPRYSAS